MLTRRGLCKSLVFAAGIPWLTAAAAPQPSGLEPITLAADWYAQPEHGGFYQALATGIYERYGLDVTIKTGNAGVNILQLLAGGAVDFAMGSAIDALQAVQSGIPVVTVAAFFQKNPQVLLTHPPTSTLTLEQLRGRPIYVSPGANVTYWPLLRSRYGLDDAQKRPYVASLTPFLLDPAAVQQGYLTSEPYRIREQAGFEPGVIPLADFGYNPYASTLETTQKMIETHPDRVQRFVDASISGWRSYLENPDPAHALIRRDNPNMTEGLLAYGYQSLKRYQILTSGEAATYGIGTMSHERWQSLFETMVEAQVLKAKIPYQNAFTLRFIQHG